MTNRVYEAAKRVADLPRPLLFALDVDGTIAPIVAEPGGARIVASALEALDVIRQVDGVEVALITGRAMESLARMEALPDIWRAVEHGGVIVAPSGEASPRTTTHAQVAALRELEGWARTRFHDAYIEVKPASVTVHTRLIAPVSRTRADVVLEQFAARALELQLHLRCGREFCEAEAEEKYKLAALRSISEAIGAASVFFAGDDVTDFQCIEEATRRGFGVHVVSEGVQDRPNIATETWPSVDTMIEFLLALRGELIR